MKNDFITAISDLCDEKNISKDVVIQAVEAALVTAYKRNFGTTQNITVRLDPATGDPRVYAQLARGRRGAGPARGDLGAGCPAPERRGPARRHPGDREDAARLWPHRRPDGQAGRHAAAARGRARGDLQRVHRQRGRDRRRRGAAHGAQGRGPLHRQGGGHPAAQRPGAHGDLPAQPAPARLRDRGAQEQQGTADHRLADPPRPDAPPLRARGARDPRRSGGDQGHRPRARLALQGGGHVAPGGAGPRGLLRGPARQPHPGHRQRAERRKDRRHPVEPGPARSSWPMP